MESRLRCVLLYGRASVPDRLPASVLVDVAGSRIVVGLGFVDLDVFEIS